MFDFLIGTIEEIYSDSIGLNVNGVGYKVFSPNPYEFEKASDPTKLFIRQVIRETDNSLYGFAKKEDRGLFDSLTSVNGIGPKSALAIIAFGDLNGLKVAIESEDTTYLTRYPGVGPKSAKMIAVSLKGKLDQTGIDTSTVITTNQNLSEALLALESLGFSHKDVTKIQKDLVTNADMSTDEYIKAGLKLLVK